jgi:hypothetical protein
VLLPCLLPACDVFHARILLAGWRVHTALSGTFSAQLSKLPGVLVLSGGPSGVKSQLLQPHLLPQQCRECSAHSLHQHQFEDTIAGLLHLLPK